MIVRDVRAYYASRGGPDVRAVDGVSLTVAEGQVLGVAGESGCGKSTLAAVISMTSRPPLHVLSGDISLNGLAFSLADPGAVPSYWYGAMVGLLPQRAMNSLNPTARVGDFVVDVMRAHDPLIRPVEAIAAARERFEQLYLPGRVLESYPHQLSGGMRQRVVAVISTLLNPRLLIADEPTSALDVSVQKQLVLLLQLLLERGFITRIIYITHDLPMLSNIAHRIAVMYAGKIVEVGTTGDVVDAPRHPYTQALIASTLDPDPRVRSARLEGIRGAPPDLRYPPGGCRFHPRCSQALEICGAEEPPLVGREGDRQAACWLLDEGRRADPREVLP